MSLLQRLYDPAPNDGDILVNGVSLSKLPLKEYRQAVGVVTQEPTLFSGSVLDNILYGIDQHDGTQQQAWRDRAIMAAKLAHADAFIRSFPAGYDTAVGEAGVCLSGGQKQRIAIGKRIASHRYTCFFSAFVTRLH